MIVVGPDEEYPFKISSLMVAEASAIKRHTGLNSRQALFQALGEDDPDAWRALVWILRKRNGQPDLAFDDCDFAYGLGDDGLMYPRESLVLDVLADDQAETDPEILAAQEMEAKYAEATRPIIEIPDEFPTDASPDT